MITASAFKITVSVSIIATCTAVYFTLFTGRRLNPSYMILTTPMLLLPYFNRIACCLRDQFKQGNRSRIITDRTHKTISKIISTRSIGNNNLISNLTAKQIKPNFNKTQSAVTKKIPIAENE